MGTRSDIIVKLADNYWKRIYCHWGGYLSNNGHILLHYYNSQAKAAKLVKNGNLSSLAEKCTKPRALKDGKPHSFDNRIEGYSVYYGRDRKEKDVDGFTGESLEAVWPEDSGTEFTYVWNGQKWLVGNPDEGTQTLIDLTDEAIAAEERGENPIKSAIKAFGGNFVIGQRA